MKLKKIKLSNFGKISNIEVEFNGSITRLVGLNGSGKTTIGLTAIWAGLKGIAEKGKDGSLIGERFRFIGPNKKSADVSITLIDELKNNTEIIVTNRITEQGNSIVFNAPDGYSVNTKWLNELFNVAFLSAKNFTQLSGKEQALLLGVDTSQFDSNIAELKSEFTLINRTIKSFGDLEEVEEKKEVSLSDLIKEKDAADKANEEAKTFNDNLDRIKKEVEDAKAQITLLQEKVTKGEAWLSNKVEKKIVPTDPIVKKIQNAEEDNKLAAAYNTYVLNKAALQKEKEKLASNKAKQEAEVKKRLDFITSFNFGIEGVSVSEDGVLLIDDKPVRDPYFSKGELELIVARLHMAVNPSLKIRFIDDLELLDEGNQEKLIKELLDHGFQVITAEVGDIAKGENTLLLREGSIVKDSITK